MRIRDQYAHDTRRTISALSTEESEERAGTRPSCPGN